MTLAEMEQDLARIVQDTSLETYFADEINAAILSIAADFDLPALRLLNPYSFSVTSANWLTLIPGGANYHKKLFRCLDSDSNEVTVLDRLEELEDLDLEHTDTGDHVTHVAMMDTGEDKYLCSYPLADDTLRLWFYQKPTTLTNPTDVCRCIPAEFHASVILPRVIIKNYQLLQDQVENFDPKSLQYWEGKQREGLYGSPAGPIGFINFLVKARGGPKRHGGRDPIA